MVKYEVELIDYDHFLAVMLDDDPSSHVLWDLLMAADLVIGGIDFTKDFTFVFVCIPFLGNLTHFSGIHFISI